MSELGPVIRRIIVGHPKRRRVAIVRVPIPAGGEVELDPSWEFAGFEADRRKPRRGQ